jgi:hypothetical protein
VWRFHMDGWKKKSKSRTWGTYSRDLSAIKVYSNKFPGVVCGLRCLLKEFSET